MTRFSQEILEKWQVRKTRRQKAAFRRRLTDKLSAAGYPVFEERHGLTSGTVNVVVGDADRADLLFTAHYDTCAVLPFPNFIAPRNLFVSVLYQLFLVLLLVALSICVQQMVFWITKSGEASFLPTCWRSSSFVRCCSLVRPTAIPAMTTPQASLR